MIDLFSTEFWLIILFVINFVLVIFLFLLIKRVNRLQSESAGTEDAPNYHAEDSFGKDDGIVSETASQIIELLKPLLTESELAAQAFDEQIREKKKLIKSLNDALDNKIININLMLSRADTLHKKIQEKEKQHQAIRPAVPHRPEMMEFDQQNRIIDMYEQNDDIDLIAQKLSVPKGEVQLVIDLKKKLIEMEKNSR